VLRRGELRGLRLPVAQPVRGAEPTAPHANHQDFLRTIMDQNQHHIPILTRSASTRSSSSSRSRSSRRDVFRGLVGTVLGLGALRLPERVEARNKKKRKKRKKAQPVQQNEQNEQNGQACPSGQQLRIVSVPSSGSTVSTPVLAAGQRYRLRASSFWNTNPEYGNDAFAAFPFANPSAPETTYQNVRLGLSVDGGSPDQWGSYNAAHIYELQVTGQGAALSLRFTDPVPADNSGSLLVEIFCA
jgi:hypothetical protein